MEDKRLTVAYVRLSQEEFGKDKEFSTSIYNQLGFIKSFATTMGLSVDKEYIDDGYSGTNFDRPGFEQLKEDIENGLVGVILTKDMSRLGRNFLETAYYMSEYFPKKNVRYISINDQYDSSNPEDMTQDVLLGIRSLINDRYVKDVSVKRKQVADAKTNEGQFIGFQAPYGYKIVKEDRKRTLEIDEYAANIVKRIFTEIASGKTRAEVAEMLNQEKVVPPMLYLKMTPSKKKKYFYDWSAPVIYRILKNQTYTGRIVKRKSSKKDYHQKKRDVIPIRDRETIENCHPAIITDELFESANNRLKQMKRKIKNNYNGLFAGLVVCGECGRIMTPCHINRPDRKVKEQYYFQCTKVVDRVPCKSRNIAESKLRAIITDTLNEIIDNYVDEKEIVDQATKRLLRKERPNLKISNLKSDIDLHNNNIRNLYLKKTKGEISLDEFIEQKETEILLKEQSEKMLKEVMESTNEEVRKEELLEKYNMFISNDELINDVVRDFIERIDVYKDNTIKISFKFGLGKPKKIRLF